MLGSCHGKPKLKMTTTHSPSRTYLMKTMIAISVHAIRRSAGAYQNLGSLFMIFIAPLMYVLRFRGELTTPVGKVRITTNESLRGFVYGFFKTQFWYLRKLHKLVPRPLYFHTVVDVGACVGDFTLAIAKKCEKVIAIEPGTENFGGLCTNVRINSLGNVVPIKAAAHNSCEQVVLDGNSSDLHVVSSTNGQSARGETLDEIVLKQGIEKIDLMKVDVQGHETFVLDGMPQMLKDHRVGLIIIEVHLKRHISVSDVSLIMTSYGYRLIARDDYLFEQPQLYFGI